MFSLRKQATRWVPRRLNASKGTVQFAPYSASVQDTPSFLHKDLVIKRASTLKDKGPLDQIVFGKNFTDHMFEVEWTKEKGWDIPRIVPYHDLSIPPSCSVLHYAIECFEGLKAYHSNNENYLFRPQKNVQRMNTSCQRIALPQFDEREFLKCMAELVNLDKGWIPNKKGYSLYIRPTAISTDPVLGVAPPHKSMLFVICSPVGPYFKTGFNPVKLIADARYVRAFPGGTGQYKLGSNYGPTILPQVEAAQKGYAQILWTLGKEHFVSEVGTMNIFFYWINKQGEKELITAPLDGTVLPGVTRDTIIEICREWGMKVTEKLFTMDDVTLAITEGRLLEAFGAGTACVVAPVNCVHFLDKDHPIPAPKDGLAPKLFHHILAIQHNEIPSKYIYRVEDIIAGKF